VTRRAVSVCVVLPPVSTEESLVFFIGMRPGGRVVYEGRNKQKKQIDIYGGVNYKLLPFLSNSSLRNENKKKQPTLWRREVGKLDWVVCHMSWWNTTQRREPADSWYEAGGNSAVSRTCLQTAAYDVGNPPECTTTQFIPSNDDHLSVYPSNWFCACRILKS
jgi:hypothetical protein